VTAPSLDALVASPHWEWLVGMAGTGFEPGRSIHVRVFADFAAVDEQEDSNIYSPRGLHPDLDDDATCGCLLALVRKAWGDPHAFVSWTSDDGWRVWVHDTRRDRHADPDDGGVVARGRETPGFALAAALLAAPAKTGGQP
jgi:hypothetical protein